MKCAYTGKTIRKWTDFTGFSPGFLKYMGEARFTSWYHAIQWLLEKGQDPNAASCFHEIESKLEGEWPAEVPMKAVGKKPFTAKNTHPRFFDKLVGASSEAKQAEKPAEVPPTVTAKMARPYTMTYLMCIPADVNKIPVIDVVPYAGLWTTIYANMPEGFHFLEVSPVPGTDFSAVSCCSSARQDNPRASGFVGQQYRLSGDVWFFRHTESPSAKLNHGTLTPAWKKFVARIPDVEYTRRTGIKNAPKTSAAVPMEE